MNIFSFNCHSVRKNENIILELTKNNDIVLLQELMIYSEDIDFVKNMNDDSECCICVNNKDKIQIINGRPNRGVAILYKKEFNNFVEQITINDRINGIIIKEIKYSSLLLNVYMPYYRNDADSLEEYCFCLGLMQSLIDDLQVNNIIIAGDLNADPKKRLVFGQS